MKTTPFWVSIALSIPALAATESTPSSATATTTTAAPSCTASLITKLCDYQKPEPNFAVAEDTNSCWEYCDAHPPCDFVIFAAGNPYTGSGTCWLYPGETFDESKGNPNCDSPNAHPYLSVYSKPVCSGGSATTTGACAATATPSAIAKVCGYPPPGGDCWDTCTASSGASNCLSQCAEADDCSYVVFNPHNGSGSQYATGTCWMYPAGKFDEGHASTCDGAPEQFVYNNVCPKPPKPSTSSSSGSSSTTGGSGTGTGAGTGTATGTATGTGTAGSAPASTTSSESSAATGLSVAGSLVLGALVPMWQALE
ncbi:uncharacterized protein N7515_004982 [Penicillium bovifimosum]|uniref:Apple domain-containing protein n=1 Tax=Penicillium bovifimosum TaxID=126998 RepID=A0A9W9L4G6_9EURO|nr:uncharacterized protein N7515_004982 [Penicillium bovifimosum]KAJ5135704.1 hypothetical protein N7515_004982 [Penicillium bovifimosum]